VITSKKENVIIKGQSQKVLAGKNLCYTMCVIIIIVLNPFYIIRYKLPENMAKGVPLKKLFIWRIQPVCLSPREPRLPSTK